MKGRVPAFKGVIRFNVMNKSRIICFLLMTALGFAAAGRLSAIERAGENSGIAIDQVGVLVYPPKMINAGVFSGEVRAVISVDDEGKLTDSLVIGYTNEGFVDAAVAALHRWTYSPATVSGRRRPARAEVLFTFRDKGVIVQNLPGAFERHRVFSGQEDRYVYRPRQLSELDGMFYPVEVVSPAVKAVRSQHSVSVEFYIDEEGKVRMPAVAREFSEDTYAAASVAAVERWRFEPPRCKGKPVLVYAQQTFTFNPKE